MPLEALPGEEYCYWHKPEDGKTPSEEQIKELKNYRIMGIYLKEADLEEVHLERAYLVMANLENADLTEANLKNATFLKAILEHAILNGADLEYADFRVADLKSANLEHANLEDTRLEYANLHAVLVSPATNFTRASLEYTNLHNSYVDQTPTLRDAVLFNKDTFMEINEIVAEFVKMKKVIGLEKLQDVNEKLANELTERGLFYYVTNGEKVAIFDPYEGFIMNPDRHLLEKKKYTRRLKNALNYFIKNFKKEKGSSADIEDLKVISLIKEGKDILYENTPETLQKLYEASYEVYNKLYYFYLQQGKFEEALQMHYRRNEVRRKLRLTKGWRSKIRAVLYDWLLMKTLTGYGIKIERPLIASLITITLFAFLLSSLMGLLNLLMGNQSQRIGLIIFIIVLSPSQA